MSEVKDNSGIPVDSAPYNPDEPDMHLGHVHIKLLSGAAKGYQRIYVELQADDGYIMHAVGPADIQVGGSLTLDCPGQGGESIPPVRQT